MKKQLCTLMLALLCATGLRAASLGDPAQPLDIKEWVKGGPVTLADGKGKTIYVVEFWATWCPPCRTSIPHLTELAKKFKDQGVVFIGISDEKSDAVKKFVEKMGDQMDYNVAIDGGKTSQGYMEAYGINGIPHAFVVNKEGNVVWQGHPMAELEETLHQIIDGKYDMSKVKKKADAQEKLQEYVKAVMGGDEEKAKKLEVELGALDKELGGIVNGEKFDAADLRARIKFSQKFMKYQQLVMRDGDAKEIADLEKELEASAPKDFDFKQFKENLLRSKARSQANQQVQKLTQDYLAAVGEKGDPTKAAELAKQLEAVETKDATTLNEIAWTILTDESVKTRDTQLALKLAKRAVDASEGKEAGIIDTYARALFDTGDTAGAITQQKKAVELAEEEDVKAELKETLAKYQAKAAAKPEAK